MQLAPGARLAPDKLMEPDPATAVGVVLQVLVKPLGVATIRPAGRLSVNAIPFNVRLALVLETVKVSDVVPFSGIVVAPKALAIVGGLMTVSVSEPVFPFPASVESMVTLFV